MTKRYQIDGPSPMLEVIQPDDQGGWDGFEDQEPEGRHALVIGNPWDEAYALLGTLPELRHFTVELAETLGDAESDDAKAARRALREWQIASRLAIGLGVFWLGVIIGSMVAKGHGLTDDPLPPVLYWPTIALTIAFTVCGIGERFCKRLYNEAINDQAGRHRTAPATTANAEPAEQAASNEEGEPAPDFAAAAQRANDLAVFYNAEETALYGLSWRSGAPKVGPGIDLAGVLIAAHIDDTGTLRVVVEPRAAEPWLLREDDTSLPMVVTVHGEEVFADPRDNRVDRPCERPCGCGARHNVHPDGA